MAIVKDIEGLQGVINVHNDLNFDQIKPFIDDIEEDHIIPIVGEVLYKKLEQDKLSADNKILADKIAKPVIALAFYNAIPYLNVGISANGLTVSTGGNEAPASQTRTEDLKRSTLNDGHNRLDKLIRFIEKNAAKYSDIKISDIYGRTSHFLPHTKAMSKFVPLNENRFVFTKMIPSLQEAETEVLQPVLGSALYNELISDFESENGLPANKETMVALCAPILSHYAFADSLTSIGLSIDERGITIFNNNYSQTVDVRVPVGATDITAMQNRHTGKGAKAIEALVAYLNNHVGDFEAFKSSAYYISGETTSSSGEISLVSNNGNIVF